MKFFLEQFRAAIRVAQILRRVAPRNNLQSNGAALKRRIQIRDPLAMRMIERFGNPENSRKPPRNPLVVAV